MAAKARKSQLVPRMTLHRPGPSGGYGELSKRPLHVLVFLLPLIVAYEVGSIVFLTDQRSGMTETIRARALLTDFFELFGVVGLFLPGAALVVILIAWHVVRRDPLRISPPVAGGMLAESVGWMLPLLVFAVVLQSAAGRAMAGTQSGEALMQLPAASRLVLSIGAGLYEELLFRMIAITVLHAVFVDLCRAGTLTGSVLAVGFSALAFAVYHDLSAEGAAVDWGLAVFYFLSGAYFGALFLVRGFGIVVGVHALYDALVLLLPQG